mmetsp:Transcript_100630/g.173860  ORF Transcript_100630/g.173860 Transcript_100630/m.173860 type:complete len:87 (+) Transcript_100630:1642-1902(+)
MILKPWGKDKPRPVFVEIGKTKKKSSMNNRNPAYAPSSSCFLCAAILVSVRGGVQEAVLVNNVGWYCCQHCLPPSKGRQEQHRKSR